MTPLLRFISLVVVGTFATESLAAGCDQTQRYSAQYRATYSDLAVEGNDLWAATVYGVELIDRTSNPPRVLGSLPLRGATTSVATSPNITYVASGSAVHVIRRALPLTVARSVDAGATVNDLLYLPPYLYAATTKGVVQLDLFVPDSPVVARTLNTTSGAAHSLARLDTTLYAADGDSSIEAYSVSVPSLPQKVGTFNSLPRSTAVNVASGRLFVSDGQQTEIFAGSGADMSRVAVLAAIGGTSVFPAADSVHWMSGTDRRLRAVDLADMSRPVVVYETATPATAGTVNRINGVTGADGQLFVAAGDAGLRTLDAAGFRRPFAFGTVATAPLRSVAVSASSVFAALDDGGILRGRVENGSFTFDGVFDQATRQTIADIDSGRLLTFAGSTISLWSTNGDPTVVSRAVLPAPVVSAIMMGDEAYAVLADRTLQKINVTTATGGGVSNVTAPNTRPSLIAREGARIATAEVSDEGRTTLRLHSADLTVLRETVIDGAATGAIAVSPDGLIAASTFRGVTIFDGITGGVVVMDGSQGVLAKDLRFRGDDLYVVTREAVFVWNSRENRLVANLALSPDVASIDVVAASGVAVIATTGGLVLIDSSRLSTLPAEKSSITTERFYSKQALTGTTLYLLEGRRVDVFRATATSLSPSGTILSSDSIVDIAATEGRLAVLSSGGKLSIYDQVSSSPSGEVTITEGNDVVFNSLHAAGRAVYLSLSKGCLSGACEKKTLVYDVDSLTQTASMSGAIVDLSIDGATGFAVTELPAEMRILNLSDPLHPTIIRSRPIERSEGIVSFTRIRSGMLAAIGQKLYTFSEESFATIAELLDSYVPDPSGRITILEQRIRVVDGCIVVIGRSHEPMLFTVDSAGKLSSSGTFMTAAAVRDVDVSPSTFHFLTDYSIDVWSNLVTPPSTRRRGGRR